MMHKPTLTIILALLLGACSETDAERTERAIRSAELKLVLPEGAFPLASYERYYAVSGTMVSGVLRHAPSEIGNFTIIGDKEHLPARNDGGCSFVTVRLNLATEKWEQVICNGYA